MTEVKTHIHPFDPQILTEHLLGTSYYDQAFNLLTITVNRVPLTGISIVHMLLVILSGPTLGRPMDSSLPGSSIHGVSRQEYWSGLPFSSPGGLPNPGIEPGSPALQP